MTSIRILEFLLLFLLQQVYSEEAEPMFRAAGTDIEMGYCFGADYIVVYRCAPEGDQLLGNSSDDSKPITPPADLQGRVHINKNQHLLALLISNLTHKDSGIYRRECWENHMLVSQHTEQLSVCDKEVKSEEIIVKEEDERAELLCNNTSTGLEGTSVRWYYEMYPFYKPTLFLDSSVSLELLGQELQGVVEVRRNGALLLLANSMLKNNLNFYCLVSKGKNCLSFQNKHLPDNSESREMFVSQGERVILKCPSDGNNQQWETPLGGITSSSMGMYISFGDKSENFSLVIPAFSDEYSGPYSCISSSLEMQYLLVLCPKKESHEKVGAEGGSVLLDCDVGKDDSQRVLWHRGDPLGKHELIHDSHDKTLPIPGNLRDRLTLSESGSSLTISHLEVKDQQVYWCVVLGSPEFLEAGDYKGDYDYNDSRDDAITDSQYWDDTNRCIFKQETNLSLTDRTIRQLITYETSPTADPPAASTITMYAVGAGLVGLLLGVGMIVAVIAMKRRAKTSLKQREAASHSGRNKTKDIKMDVDPGCTERLTHNYA
ncbi:uncharacterized protein LOC118495465 [Sander lucioperca]|uniref:uncharacterized protein LOC118495465 n=1 Tax=Sander lucioperca TaxID=283035 RepID=UPI001653A3B9|nr:uncharacterized protein LOC118495465 [Sander lucioperca]